MSGLVDAETALEAVTAENESLRRFDWVKRNRAVEAERDELRKVVEKVRAWNTHDRYEPKFWDLHHIYAKHEAQKPEPVPELFPGVAGALDDLTIWKDMTDE